MTPPTSQSHGPAWWPFSLVRKSATEAGVRRVVLAWLVGGVAAILLAALEATQNWSAIPVDVGGTTLSVSVYPPLLVTLLLTVWLGPLWGIIPAYLATFTSAVVGGMSWPTATLFATATPVELLIVWGSMVLLGVDPELRQRGAMGRFIAAAVIAAIASSLAGLIYIDVQRLDLLAGQRIWQGWILGDLLQLCVVAPPILRFAGPPIRGWIDRQIPMPPRQSASYPSSVLVVVVLVTLMAATVFQGAAMIFDSIAIPAEARTSTGEPLLPRIREILWFMGLLLVVAMITTTAFASVLARTSERERKVSHRDLLTGALNRRGFYGTFQKESDRSKRLGRGVSLIFFDVDHFKELNDSFGHEMGDEVLRQLVRRVQGAIREHDVLFRWGGEEFVVLLPHTDPADAPGLAERIRAVVAGRPLIRELVEQPIRVTISLGTTGAAALPVAPDELVARADAACYVAKRQGRNRVERGTDVPNLELLA